MWAWLSGGGGWMRTVKARSKIPGILRLKFECDSTGMTNFYPGALLQIGRKKVA